MKPNSSKDEPKKIEVPEGPWHVIDTPQPTTKPESEPEAEIHHPWRKTLFKAIRGRE